MFEVGELLREFFENRLKRFFSDGVQDSGGSHDYGTCSLACKKDADFTEKRTLGQKLNELVVVIGHLADSFIYEKEPKRNRILIKDVLVNDANMRL